MTCLKKLRVELDIPVFWRNSWKAAEGAMLDWLETSLVVRELVLVVLWDVDPEGMERRKRFGQIDGKVGERRNWKVERLERKGEEGNIWEREWGYLVDIGMSG